MKKIVIEVNEVGHGKILVDGRDISSSVHAVNVKIRPGNLSRVFVMMHGDAQMSMLADMEERRG
jgi:hypothetical protein